ncbi:hypothetical protein KFE25_010007 [Diacronema lutheri]|uniref:C3HC-type domain-containing protein n=1 Tax=Diacronema lutheri TaxID=2081491 RepID=A0A8J5XJQ6_DIALT|nr:hypothetical protein KFE25_010007 [Diacronema lutheri]
MSRAVERASAALSRLESALDEGAAEGAAATTPACIRSAPASGGDARSVFSFGSGSPFGAASTGRRLSLDADAATSMRASIGATLGGTLVAGEQADPGDPGSIASCRPWSRADMTARLGTFSPRRWFGKPLRASPQVCARHGWTNPEYDVLVCASCAARLRAPRALDGWSTGATAAFERLLDEGHAELCPWRGNACPPDLLAIVLPAAAQGAATGPSASEPAAATPYVVVAGRSRALATLRARYRALAGPGPEPPAWYVPAVDGGFIGGDLAHAAVHARLAPSGRVPTEADGLALLAALADAAQLPDAPALRCAAAAAAAEAGAAVGATASGSPRLAVATSALCLALLGWTWSVPPAAAVQGDGALRPDACRGDGASGRLAAGTLWCAESARRLGVWHFCAAGAEPAPADAPAAAATAALSVGSKRPRNGGVAVRARALHPAREHAGDSPWVHRLPAGDAAALVPAWAVAAALLLPARANEHEPAGRTAATPRAAGAVFGAGSGALGLLHGALNSV